MSPPRSLTLAENIDALAQLRAATHTRHAQLDAGLAVSAPGAGIEAYRSHLRLLWQWLAPLQAWLDAQADGPQDARLLEPSPRLQWLAEDLAELDGAAPVLAARLPRSSPASAEFRWGVCYVIEGSQLGGRAILRQLESRLGTHRPRLLAGGGAEVQAQRWQDFLASLRREVRSPRAIAESCEGARFAFDRMLLLAGLA